MQKVVSAYATDMSAINSYLQSGWRVVSVVAEQVVLTGESYSFQRGLIVFVLEKSDK